MHAIYNNSDNNILQSTTQTFKIPTNKKQTTREILFGPALLDAGRRVLCNQLRQSVRQSVCQSVTKVLILPAIRFFLIFCIKLAHYKRFKVTKPDFRKKKSWPKFWPKLGPKWGFWPTSQQPFSKKVNLWEIHLLGSKLLWNHSNGL